MLLVFENRKVFLTRLTAILLAHHPFDAQPDGVVHVRISSSGCDIASIIPGASGRNADATVADRAFVHDGSRNKK